jgi:hypothetical protein
MKKHSEEYSTSMSEFNIDKKICTKCKIGKSLDSFNNDRTKKDGKTSNCKDCRKNKTNRN